MSKEDIVFDWLSVKENRDKIQEIEVTKSHLDAFQAYGWVYTFGEDKLYCLSEQIYKIKIKIENDTIQATA